METEEKIVYQLLDEIRGSQLNNDEVIDEREVRSFLREHRPFIINRAFNNGLTVSGIEFQSLGTITLVEVSNQLTYALPSIVRLPNNAGVRITTLSGYNIPLVSKESVYLSLNNPIGQFQPKAYIEGNTLIVFPPVENDDAMNDGSGLDNIITEISTTKELLLDCILQNPDDGTGYDWTASEYPLSQELISVLKNEVRRRNLNIIINAKTDEVTNMKNDSITYHDELRNQ